MKRQMMKINSVDGIYRFYLGDEIVYESHNALTVAGRSIAAKALLGLVPGFAGYLVYGVGDSPNNYDPNNLISNNRLDFEIGRVKTRGTNVKVSNNTQSLVYTSRIETPDTFLISEVGLFPQYLDEADIGVQGTTLFNFNSVDVFEKYGSASAAEINGNEAARIGTDFLFLPQTSSATDYLQYNVFGNQFEYISSYSSLDNFRLAGFNISSSVSNIHVSFHTNESSYYDVVFNSPNSSGYFVAKTNKGAASIIGDPSWENITSIRIYTDSPTGIFLDGLKIDIGPYYLSTINGMISRSVLPAPIRKPSAIPMTIEYALNISFNQLGPA